jgi:hypothetical protein
MLQPSLSIWQSPCSNWQWPTGRFKDASGLWVEPEQVLAMRAPFALALPFRLPASRLAKKHKPS